MIDKRPYVGWTGDGSSGGLTLRPAWNVDEGVFQDMPEIDLGHGIPTEEALMLARELEDVLERIVQAQRNYPKPEPCTAILWHGPGHQSQSRCEITGPHEVHETHYGPGDLARWRTGDYTGRLREQGIDFDPESYPEDMGMTGFFDEPPRGDDA